MPLANSGARTPRWGLGAFLLVELVYLLVSLAFLPLFVHGKPTSASTLALAVVVPTLAAAGLALLITQLRGNGPRIDLRLQWSARGLRLGLLFGIGGLFITLPAAMIYQSIVGPDANSAAGALFSGVRASWTWAIIAFLVIAFVAPICEEVVYRGLLWGALDRRWGQWVALTVSTVVFALAHLELTRIPLLLVVASHPHRASPAVLRRSAGKHRRAPDDQPVAGRCHHARTGRRHADELSTRKP